ncbi:MAG: acyl-CoA/acyl-ACP dehydrogenase [Rhizobiaceae bacterium]|nr:acyl-CoA/acyl-ACP dehydrogenase [Rhizobiaceae bacterium]
MDLSLTEDQLFMRDEANRFLAERATSEAVRAAIASGGFDKALWDSISNELGWCGIAIPEDAGGLGLGAFEMVLLLEEIGRRLAPVPFWTTVSVCAPVIRVLATDETRLALLGRIASGNAAATVALPRPAANDPFEAIEFNAEPDGRGWILSGRCAAVFNLACADLVVVPARLNERPALFAVERSSLSAIAPHDTLDPTMPVAPLSLAGVPVGADARIDRGDLDTGDFAAPLLWARLGLAAEQVGAASGCLELTLAYISERVQFGRSIASFQAVKHRCAELLVRIGEARSLLYGAAACLDAGGDDVAREIEGAGVLASEALWHAAEEAIQLHGGVGNTWEYDPHLYLRRAQATAHLFGSADAKLSRLAEFLQEAAA